MNARQKHIEIIASLMLRGDKLMAYRHYIENRVSYAAFREALSRAERINAASANNGGFLFKRATRENQ